MLNWIIYFLSILTLASLPIPRDSSSLNTLAPNDNLLLRLDGSSAIPLLVIAILCIVLVFTILNFTVLGKKQKVTGLSNTGALAAGYNVKANLIVSMAISGANSELISGPDIISKGFVFMKEAEELIQGLKEVVNEKIFTRENVDQYINDRTY